jgi:phosphatidylserine decarboxylase
MIKFGSRTDVLIPADAELKVKTGTRVKGGASILAVLPRAVGGTVSVAAAEVS